MRECFQASVNQVDHSGQSPLHIACANGNVEIVALLLEHQSNPNLVLMPVSVREYQWEHVWAGRTMIHNIPRCLVEGQMGRDPAARGVTSRVVADSSAGEMWNGHSFFFFLWEFVSSGFSSNQSSGGE